MVYVDKQKQTSAFLLLPNVHLVVIGYRMYSTMVLGTIHCFCWIYYVYTNQISLLKKKNLYL